MGTYMKAGSDNLGGVYSAFMKPGEAVLSKIRLTSFTADLIKQLNHDKWSSEKEKNFGICQCLTMETTELENGDFDMTGILSRIRYNNYGQVTQLGDIVIVHFNKGEEAVSKGQPLLIHSMWKNEVKHSVV